jgi:hypothetical protein
MRRYRQAFSRHPILLTLPMVLALVIGVGASLKASRVYQGGVSLWCDTPVPNPSSILDSTGAQPAVIQRTVLTEFLASRTFLTKVAQAGPWAGYLATHSQTENLMLVSALGADVGVSTQGPHLLSITTKGKTPDDALALAKAVSVAYISEVNLTQSTRAKSSVGFFQSQVDSAAKALSDAQGKLTKYLEANKGTGPLSAVADATAAQLTQQVNTAQSNYDAAKSSAFTASSGLSNVGDSGVLRVFDPANVSPAPVKRSKKKIIFAGVAGLFGGAMISFFTLLLMVMGDRSVRSAGEIEVIPGMQVVGTVEHFHPERRQREIAS